MTVKEAEQATRINRLHLAALEEENFSALPPLTYQRGIVRNYATYLDLDPARLIALFEEARGGALAPLSVVASSPPVDMPRQWVPNFAVLAFLVVMSAVVFTWSYSAYFAPGDSSPTATPAAPSVTPLPSDDPTALEGWTIVPTMEPLPTEVPSPTATPDDEDDADADATVGAGSDGSDATETADSSSDERETLVATEEAAVDSGDVEAASQVETPTEVEEEPFVEEVVEEALAITEEPSAPEGDLTQLQFVPTSDVTLSVIGDGQVLYDGYLTAGSVIGPFSAVSFEIYTSNVGATQVVNVATGASFLMAYDEVPMSFFLP